MKELVAIAEKIAVKLIERKQTIAIAESSTGGLISAALLSVPGALSLVPVTVSSAPRSVVRSSGKGAGGSRDGIHRWNYDEVSSPYG